MCCSAVQVHALLDPGYPDIITVQDRVERNDVSALMFGSNTVRLPPPAHSEIVLRCLHPRSMLPTAVALPLVHRMYVQSSRDECTVSSGVGESV